MHLVEANQHESIDDEDAKVGNLPDIEVCRVTQQAALDDGNEAEEARLLPHERADHGRNWGSGGPDVGEGLVQDLLGRQDGGDGGEDAHDGVTPSKVNVVDAGDLRRGHDVC